MLKGYNNSRREEKKKHEKHKTEYQTMLEGRMRRKRWKGEKEKRKSKEKEKPGRIQVREISNQTPQQARQQSIVMVS